MEKDAFEGTVVLEKLALIDGVDDFFEAIDADDFEMVKRLMKAAGIDAPTIAIVLHKMAEADGEH